MKLLILSTLTALLTISLAASCSGTSRYKLTIGNTATRARFPNLPADNIHFSPLTAFTHSNRYSAFTLYAYASIGVKDVAETGNNTQLLIELESGRSKGFVSDIQTESPALFARNNYSVVLEASCKHQFIGAITMVAPSPDWFVAVSRLNVVGRNGAFINRAFGRLRVYDAGTDSGEMLNSRNEVTNPVENIAPLKGEPFMGRVVGRYLLEKME